MQAIINPSRISGSITPPASKSMMQRACAGALLHEGRTIISNPGRSDDDIAALNIIRDLGARVVERSAHEIEIVSDGQVRPPSSIDCGESGLSARMFAPIVALADKQVTLMGRGSLLHRPMNALQEILLSLGANLNGFNGYLPMTVQGPLQPRNISIASSHSSQYLTGVLFALSASAQRQVAVEVAELYSKPYVDLTLSVLKAFGKNVEHEDYQVFYIDPSAFRREEEVAITIESDWSSAAYWLAAAGISGSISVQNLDFSSTQADKAIAEVLSLMGAEVIINGASLSISSASVLKACEYDATHCPDLFPILSILAASAEGESKINGVKRLIHKESNRCASITDMLEQFDVQCSVQDDSMLISGRGKLKATTINSHNDHRIAMAATIGALTADGEVVINDAQAVSKSYPNFFDDLASLGAQVELKT